MVLFTGLYEQIKGTPVDETPPVNKHKRAFIIVPFTLYVSFMVWYALFNTSYSSLQVSVVCTVGYTCYMLGVSLSYKHGYDDGLNERVMLKP